MLATRLVVHDTVVHKSLKPGPTLRFTYTCGCGLLGRRTQNICSSECGSFSAHIACTTCATCCDAFQTIPFPSSVRTQSQEIKVRPDARGHELQKWTSSGLTMAGNDGGQSIGAWEEDCNYGCRGNIIQLWHACAQKSADGLLP